LFSCSKFCVFFFAVYSSPLQGSVQRAFLTLVFFIKRLILAPLGMLISISNYVEFSRSYSYLKCLKIAFPQSMTAASKKKSLSQPIFYKLQNVPGELGSTCIADFLLRCPFKDRGAFQIKKKSSAINSDSSL
jgi:hypothetical protein